MKLTSANFLPHINSAFQNDILGALRLEKVTELPRGNTPYHQFSLSFVSDCSEAHAQGTYALSHGALPALEVFLVPVAKTEHGIRYLASFSVER